MRSQTPTVGEIQASLTRRGFPTWVIKVPALKGPPIVKRRGAAAKGEFLRPNKYHLSTKRLFHGRNFVVWADPKCPNSRAPAEARSE